MKQWRCVIDGQAVLFLLISLFLLYYTNSSLWHLVFNYMFYHSFAPAASCIRQHTPVHFVVLRLSYSCIIELSKMYVLVRKLEFKVIVLIHPAKAEGRDRRRLTSV